MDDLALAVVSRIKTGSPTSFDYSINQMYYDTLIHAMVQVGVHESQHNMVLEGFLGLLRSQTVAPLDQTTFEAYKEQRSISCAGM